jgi:hypothetical protein
MPQYNVTGFKVSQLFVAAVYSALGFLHLMDISSITSKALHMGAACTSETSQKLPIDTWWRPKSRININIII